MAGRFVVLMYHGFESPEEPTSFMTEGARGYAVTPAAFREQMALLAERKTPVVLLEEGLASTGETAVVLTFDDGHETSWTKAFPVLRERGFRAYFFVTTDWIGEPRYLTEPMLRALHDSGMVVGSHAASHRYLTDLDERMIARELFLSRERLASIIGAPVTAFSAPGGRLNGRVVRAARRAGYNRIFGSAPIVCETIAPDAVIGRFAVTKGTSFERFARIAAGSPPRFERARYEILRVAKGALGNRAYEAARRIVLREP